MVTSLNEINDFKSYMVNNRHGSRIAEQNLDQTYFEDTYSIPIPKFVNAEYIFRTGFVSSLTNSITQQAIAYVPKVYTETKNKTSQIGADRVASICNKWCKVLGKQSTNPFRDTFKNIAFTRGEAWVYITHNDILMKTEGWQELYDELPIYFIRFDPLVVFHEPSEEIDGKPKRVLVNFKRLAAEIHAEHPNWTPKTSDKEVEYWYYMDKDTRYAVADSKPLFTNEKGEYSNGNGTRTNPYNFVSFVHRYSGYGVETQSKNPSLLAFTRTRMIRDKVKEDAKMSTEFNYNQSELVWKIRNLLWPLNTPLPPDLLAEYRNKPGALNVLTVPSGVEPKVEDSRSLGADAYAYRNTVRADLNMEHPLALQGIASGSSGRQEDIMSSAGMSMYDSPIEANGSLWAEVFDLAVKMCAIKELNILPKGLNVTDKDSYSDLRVEIRRDDPTDMSRRAAEGDRRYQAGIIDLEELYINYMGKTKEESDRLRARVMIELAKRNDPAFMQMITQIAAEEMGQQDRLKQIRDMISGATKAVNPVPQIGSEGGEPRVGNFQSPEGMNQADVATRHEPRMSPGQGA